MQTCPRCRIGTLQRKAAPYATWHSDEFVVIPALTTWVCDVCGERIYDPVVLDALQPLLGPSEPHPDEAPGDVRRNPDTVSPFGNPRTRRRA